MPRPEPKRSARSFSPNPATKKRDVADFPHNPKAKTLIFNISHTAHHVHHSPP